MGKRHMGNVGWEMSDESTDCHQEITDMVMPVELNLRNAGNARSSCSSPTAHRRVVRRDGCCAEGIIVFRRQTR